MKNSEYNPEYDKDGLSKPIRISDIVIMFKKRIDPNERPYVVSVLKSNNNLVDEWYSEVLKNICNRECMVKAGQVFYEWEYFYNGKTIKNFVENIGKGFIVRPSTQAVDYWLNVFNTFTIEQMIELGSNCVGNGWKLIQDEIYIKRTLDRWDKIYSKSDNPLEWRKLANDFPKLWSMECDNPFWSEEQCSTITQKVMSILKNPVSPQ